MSCWTRRRVYLLFLTITIFQILTTTFRQVFDFLGPLWSLILTNFLNIVFTIFGFFGGYTRRTSYLLTYSTWHLGWCIWNTLILYLYLQPDQPLKSSILSLQTGAFSWWETRAPGCVPDWGVENTLFITNCMFNPKLVETLQAAVQIFLSVCGILTAIGCIIWPYRVKEEVEVDQFYSLSRRSMSSGRRSARRNHADGVVNHGVVVEEGGASGTAAIDDRLRPMTPRKVKRRSARSIQSNRFGPAQQPSTSSLRRSRQGSRNHFVSPVNRLIQLDSETSHDETVMNVRSRGPINNRNPHYRNHLQNAVVSYQPNHLNPVYLNPHQHLQPPSTSNNQVKPPPRPPSARSSYSNYHPARLYPYQSNQPNIFNQQHQQFVNAGFDSGGEAVYSPESSMAAGGGLYDERDGESVQYVREGLGSSTGGASGGHGSAMGQFPTRSATAAGGQLQQRLLSSSGQSQWTVKSNSTEVELQTVAEHHRLAAPGQFQQAEYRPGPGQFQQQGEHRPSSGQQLEQRLNNQPSGQFQAPANIEPRQFQNHSAAVNPAFQIENSTPEQQRPSTQAGGPIPAPRLPPSPNPNPFNNMKKSAAPMVYPLAHSPVSQDSFPMWSAQAQAQVPNHTNNNHHHSQPPQAPRKYPQSILRPMQPVQQHQQPINSETVI